MNSYIDHDQRYPLEREMDEFGDRLHKVETIIEQSGIDEKAPHPSDRMEDLISQIAVLRAQVEQVQDSERQFGHRIGQFDIRQTREHDDRIAAENVLRETIEGNRQLLNGVASRLCKLENERLDAKVGAARERPAAKAGVVGPHHTVNDPAAPVPVQPPNLTHIANSIAFLSRKVDQVLGGVNQARGNSAKTLHELRHHLMPKGLKVGNIYRYEEAEGIGSLVDVTDDTEF